MRTSTATDPADELGRNRADYRVRVQHARDAGRGIGLELAEQVVHPRNRILDRLKHIVAKFRIVNVMPCIRYDQI